jgi:DNA replication factor CDT1 like/DNA replication factor Cdt1 C-terminal domain
MYVLDDHEHVHCDSNFSRAFWRLALPQVTRALTLATSVMGRKRASSPVTSKVAAEPASQDAESSNSSAAAPPKRKKSRSRGALLVAAGASGAESDSSCTDSQSEFAMPVLSQGVSPLQMLSAPSPAPSRRRSAALVRSPMLSPTQSVTSTIVQSPASMAGADDDTQDPNAGLNEALHTLRKLTPKRSGAASRRAASDGAAAGAAAGDSPTLGSPAATEFLPPAPVRGLLLQSMFEALDSVMCLFRLRRQQCALRQMKQRIEQACKRDFSQSHLARILTVFPEAYKVTRTAVGPARAGLPQQYDIALDIIVAQSAACPTLQLAGHLAARQREFRTRLAAAMSQYCSCQRSSANEHSYSGDCEGDCIPCAALPALSDAPVQQQQQQQQQQAAAGSSSTLKAFAALAQGSAGTNSTSSSSSNSSTSGSSSSSAEMAALQERLRARDRAAAAAAARPAAEVAAEKRRKSDLPRLANALRSYLAQRQRTSAYLDTIAEELRLTGPVAVSVADVRKRLRMLAAIVPEWCSLDETSSSSSSSSSSSGSSSGSAATAAGGRGLAPGKAVLRMNTAIKYADMRNMLVFMLETGQQSSGTSINSSSSSSNSSSRGGVSSSCSTSSSSTGGSARAAGGAAVRGSSVKA